MRRIPRPLVLVLIVIAFIGVTPHPGPTQTVSEIRVVSDDNRGVKSQIYVVEPDNKEVFMHETDTHGVVRPNYKCKQGQRFKAKPEDLSYYHSRPTPCRGPTLTLTVITRIDAVYNRALKEGGTLNFYGTLAEINAAKILPVFEKRFPGIKVNHIDATADKLAARAITEARGGRTIGDVFQGSLENIVQVYEQGLILDNIPPEAADYPANLKGSYWVATDLIFFIGAWNTNLVKKGDEPKSFEDFADPKWKGKLIAEPRDVEVLIGLATQKYKSEEKAIALFRKIAANNIEFHRGHSQLAEFLVAGQAAACLTCYSHHFPSRIKKGAPVNYFLTEGVGAIGATAVFKNAPHPNTAWLFARWLASEEGQKAYAIGGRIPAHPRVEPVERGRPEKIYPIGVAELKQWPKYEKIWQETFKLR